MNERIVKMSVVLGGLVGIALLCETLFYLLSALGGTGD